MAQNSRRTAAARAGSWSIHQWPSPSRAAVLASARAAALVDEMTLLIVPVVLGQGTRLFPGTGPDLALDLAGSRADSKGVMIQVYRPAGRPRYAAG